jgi:hypothetical protein
MRMKLNPEVFRVLATLADIEQKAQLFDCLLSIYGREAASAIVPIIQVQIMLDLAALIAEEGEFNPEEWGDE